MTKIVIVRVSGNELANQLWNYASIYAYARERGYALENPSFFEYGSYFTVPAPNLFLKLFFFRPFAGYLRRKHSVKRRVWRKLYGYYANMTLLLHKSATLVSDNKDNRPLYLPPTKKNEKLALLEKSTDTIYFDGWIFRNPAGLQQYKREVMGYLKPRQDIEQAIETRMKDLRSKFKNVVGVHIRQSDYKTWRNGAYFIPQGRVREILEEYFDLNGEKREETCFVITSDEKINAEIFTGLNISVASGSAAHDLFLLASTDTILGSNSTFGAFASYWGGVPFIVMQKEPMDWEYYREKKGYFENKYSTFVHY